MIYEATEANINKAANILKEGGLVALPTETVYGLGGNALDPQAAARIFEAKKRPHFDPLITHIADMDMLDEICVVPDKYRDILSRIWPASLTVIVPRKQIIPDLITSGLDTMAVRMPDHPIALEVIRRSTGAIAAPSANPFGYLSPTTAEHVESQLGMAIDMILQGGPCRVGVESTVLDLTQETPVILRPGGFSIEELSKLFEGVKLFDRQVVTPSSPGQLKMHYSPRTPLYIVDGPEDVPPELASESAYLGFRKDELNSVINFCHTNYLSDSGDFIQAASRLFILLHELDEKQIKAIYAQKVPEEGLGRAVMDRLYKASVK
ncbi:L-threonylcarbamoyladenylate synthase [Spirochaeta cellobiosiphila]|uniref:L-threonylcarbamoyladenylate synthase n=1 Tax=Spirochaeta cellobiosiphila TaxID=504483 RepID=UPI000426991E|nr:L-threonylcarbamoyladenylate synthase [Spirochaeta cellobiosiphila]